jgi:hypothetical protein
MFHVWPRREELQPITFFSSRLTPDDTTLDHHDTIITKAS